MLIVASVIAVMLDSVAAIRAEFGTAIFVTEWLFTALFTAEYLLRLFTVRRPLRYALSFYGIIDLLSIVPTYLSLVFPGAQTLLVLRAFRLLRVFRILKLGHFLAESRVLVTALTNSRRKIIVFLGAVLTIVVIMGTLMYLIEGEPSGFSSIPRGMYWAIVTLTTVGYGDVYPRTDLGRVLASILMIMGYGIIAVPTGIVSVELAHATREATAQACPDCGVSDHDVDAKFCKRCGARL